MGGSFLDQQARIGISVHLGGLPATRRLLSLCHLTEAHEVLEVGCGIGVGPTHTARTHGCRVVGVDCSPRMIDWACDRAREQGVEDRVSLLVADVLDLPFEDDRFDVVLAESVLAFVVDKERARAEMVRVTKPGGYVGLNEGFLVTETPSPRVDELARRIGSAMVTLGAWRTLWEASGLDERSVRTYRLDPTREIRDRFRWVGFRRLLAGSIGAVRLYLTEPSSRPVLDTMLVSLRAGSEGEPEAPPPRASFGYGLFVGRKAGGVNGTSRFKPAV
ncbi:MAG: class I SAM-dependent methyltransferase [Candidatus Limnocylindrales bacterium]